MPAIRRHFHLLSILVHSYTQNRHSSKVNRLLYFYYDFYYVIKIQDVMKTIYFLFFLSLFVSCSDDDATIKTDNDPPIPQPTEEKVTFLKNMTRVANEGKIFIGHQSTNVSGIDWRYNHFPNGDKSDFKDISGKMPAVMGWEFAPKGTSFTNNYEDIPYDKIIELANQNTANNGINTFSLHPDRFDKNGGSWFTGSGSVQAILPKGAQHDVYKKYLDDMASKLKQLKLPNGKPAPFIFRPFHEMDGEWFWWGTTSCTDQEYITLFKFTIDYLKSKNLPNMVVCYSPGYSTNANDYLKRYPGDDYVDILGIDAYHLSTAQYSNNGANWDYNKTKLLMLQQVGQQKNKPIVWAETGQQNITSNTYFTELTQFIKSNNLKISYLMFWSNATTTVTSDGGNGFYVPYSAMNNTTLKTDFIGFTNQSNYIFQNSQESIYK